MLVFLSMGPTFHVKVLGPGSHIYSPGSQVKGPGWRVPGPRFYVKVLGSSPVYGFWVLVPRWSVPGRKSWVKGPKFQVLRHTFPVCLPNYQINRSSTSFGMLYKFWFLQMVIAMLNHGLITWNADPSYHATYLFFFWS